MFMSIKNIVFQYFLKHLYSIYLRLVCTNDLIKVFYSIECLSLIFIYTRLHTYKYICMIYDLSVVCVVDEGKKEKKMINWQL